MKSWKYSVIANILGGASTFIFNFVFTPIYVRVLGIEAYSVIAFFTTLLAMTFVLRMTFGATMTRELAQASFSPQGAEESRDLARTLEWIYLIFSIGFAALGLVLAPWIATSWLKVETLPLDQVTDAVAMMGISVALQAPLAIYAGGLYGLERQGLFNILFIAAGAVRGVGAVVVIWFIAPTVTVFLAWQMVFSLLQLIVFGVLFWRCMPPGSRAPRFSGAALRRTGRFTGGMAATGAVTFFLSQINGVLLSKFLPLSQLGIFQIANQVNTGARILGTLIESAILPRLSFHSGAKDEEALRQVYHEACQFTALLVLPASLIVILFARGLIFAWIGDGHIADQAAPVAAVLVAGSAINSLLRVPYQVTVARGWSMFGFYQNLFAVVGFLPFLVYLIHSHGVIGAAYAWLILNILYIVISAPIIHHYMLSGEFMRWIRADVVAPVAVTGAFVLSAHEVVSQQLPPVAFVAVLFSVWLASMVICAVSMRYTRKTLARLMTRLIKVSNA